MKGYIEFYEYIRRYFREFLKEQRNLSEHTIRYYRDTLNRFIEFLKNKYSIDHTKLSIDLITPESVNDFLAWLASRGNSLSTRNRRLAAIKIFMSYIAMMDETFCGQLSKIQAIKPLKIQLIKNTSDKAPEDTTKFGEFFNKRGNIQSS